MVPAGNVWLVPALAIGGMFVTLPKGYWNPVPVLNREATSDEVSTLFQTPTSSMVPGNPAEFVGKFFPNAKS